MFFLKQTICLFQSHKIQSHQPQQQQQVTQTQPQQQQQQQQPQNTLKIKNCESCGAPLPQDNNKKRAVMKVKCETCLSAEAIQPQIFVVATAPDTSAVKFEESTGTQTTSTLGKGNIITEYCDGLGVKEDGFGQNCQAKF